MKKIQLNQIRPRTWVDRLLKQKIIWKYPGFGPHTIFSLNDNHSDFYFNSDYLANKPILLKLPLP